jgi:hypothetical protein
MISREVMGGVSDRAKTRQWNNNKKDQQDDKYKDVFFHTGGHIHEAIMLRTRKSGSRPTLVF